MANRLWSNQARSVPPVGKVDWHNWSLHPSDSPARAGRPGGRWRPGFVAASYTKVRTKFEQNRGRADTSAPITFERLITFLTCSDVLRRWTRPVAHGGDGGGNRGQRGRRGRAHAPRDEGAKLWQGEIRTVLESVKVITFLFLFVFLR